MDSKVACIFWRLILSQLFICSYFLPFWGFCFYLAFSFLCCTNDFKFNQVPLVIFIFISIILSFRSLLHPSVSFSQLFVASRLLFEKALATHSSTLAWKLPWTQEPGKLQSMGSLRVRHDWVTSLSLSCIGEENGNPLQCSCL